VAVTAAQPPKPATAKASAAAHHLSLNLFNPNPVSVMTDRSVLSADERSSYSWVKSRNAMRAIINTVSRGRSLLLLNALFMDCTYSAFAAHPGA
jgi:hypothetical protein